MELGRDPGPSEFPTPFPPLPQGPCIELMKINILFGLLTPIEKNCVWLLRKLIVFLYPQSAPRQSHLGVE